MNRIRLLILAAVMASSITGYTTEGAERNEALPVDAEIPRISAFEAKKLFDQGKLILANAHESGPEFEKTRLIGAISLPNGEVQSTNPSLPEDVVVAFYCM